MIKQKTIASLVKEHKTVFIIIAVVLFLIELEIFAVAAMKSGREKWLQIVDKNGHVIYETDGKNLSDFNKYYFEKTFGPLNQFEKKLEIRENPFPFRAWFTAAVGIPIGVILLFAFVVKSYVSLFYGDKKEDGDRPDRANAEYRTEFERIIATVSSFNIFTIGFLILLAVFMYWVLPNMVAYIGKVSVDTLVRFKWVVIGAACVVVGLVIWIVYLRYLLARRSIDNQAELERARLQLEFGVGGKAPIQLEYAPGGNGQPRLVEWEEKDGDGVRGTEDARPAETENAEEQADEAVPTPDAAAGEPEKNAPPISPSATPTAKSDPA
ncbi:hypothetical protein DENIS_0852 [Desulfonema ishimotonii]|uniref:Uncharacterized protein n=1 Tax=Desulfonema ishimotonii TaxID=45657 RepID=A0A401FSI7_9BACT|nr:hypothetical protein [Desulfonema ishimotonii]GBC59910.1 hypothetical protein DENIS_0852 [Desulfonema ishimotonii]